MSHTKQNDVSLIITTYNRPEALEQTLKSVLKQTCIPKEVIIADDGSDSRTADLVRKYQKILPLDLRHSWQEDRGYRLAASKNKAVASSTGDYLVFMDGDMILDHRCIEDYVNFRQPNFFLNGSYVRIYQELTNKIFTGEIESPSFWSKGIKRRQNALYIPFLHKFVKGPQYTYKRIRGGQCSMWKDDFIKVNGFDEQFEGWGYEDFDLGYRLMNAGVKRTNIKFCAITYHLYHTPSSRSSTVQNWAILEKTIRTKKIWAEKGINQYLLQSQKVGS